jgi:hypothetical protein
LADPDFNKQGGIEGTGSDYVLFKVPLNGFTGLASVYSRLYYQAVPPKWVDEMFNYNSNEINVFKPMYLGADHTPVLVASDSLINLPIITGFGRTIQNTEPVVFPTLSENGQLWVKFPGNHSSARIDVYAADGRKVKSAEMSANEMQIQLKLPDSSGIYFVQVLADGKRTIRKVYRK